MSFLLDWDWPAVEQARRRALELNPGSSQVLSDFTTYLVAMRRFDDAIAGAVRACELDPLSTDTSVNLAWAYFMCRQYQKALDGLDRLESLHPDHPFAVTLRTWTYWFMGNTDKALDMAQRAAPLLTGSFELLACIGFIYGAAGRTAEAREILNRLLARSEHQYVNPIALVFCYAGLSDLDRTFEYLTKSYEDRSLAMVYLAQMADLWFAGISGDPRYKELLEKMDLLDVAPLLPTIPPTTDLSE